jgi:FkbM family methyltransferase
LKSAGVPWRALPTAHRWLIANAQDLDDIGAGTGVTISSVLKRTIQRAAHGMGYRVVPRDRDAMTLKTYLDRLAIRTVIDVGANNGETSQRWLATYPMAQVHAFEALDRYLPQLMAVSDASNGRMTVWPYAASDEAGQVTFLEHEDHPSSSSLLPGTETSHQMLPFTRKERALSVQAVRPDALFAERNVALEPEILIKLDVQGAELKVLKGCEGFLGRVRAIQCEVNLAPMYVGQPRLTELIDALAPHGLDFAGVLEQFHARDGSAVYLDAVFLRR